MEWYRKQKSFQFPAEWRQWHSNVVWQTVLERRIGSSERSVANSPTMSARHVELLTFRLAIYVCHFDCIDNLTTTTTIV